MTNRKQPKLLSRLFRMVGLTSTLGLLVVANLGDRAFSASPANAGIDPLEILDTAVKNNILFVVDTSGSMAGTPEDQNRIMGGDDPASRFYQVKRAVREVITANAGKANFGLATFHPDFAEHRIDEGNNQGLIYVTQDPTAANFINYFDAVSFTLANVNQDTCLGAGGVCSTALGGDAQKIFRGFRTAGDSAVTTPYPTPCIVQPAGNQVAVSGAANPPITHVNGVPGSNHCRYYLKSSQMRVGKRYNVKRGLASGAAAGQRQVAAIVSSQNIACPPPPPGLVGDDVLAAANGSLPRACVQFRDVTSAVVATQLITTYWMTGTNFDFENVGAGSTDQCAQSGINVGVAPCLEDNTAQINSYMRQELQYDGPGGTPRGIAPFTTLSLQRPNLTETPPFSLDVTPPITPPFLNPGIRQGNGTPLAASMNFALTYFNSTVLPGGGTPQRPLAAQGRQKQYVILLTDGDESCTSQAAANTAAFNLWNNGNTAVAASPTNLYPGACNAACLAAKGITADQWSVSNRIELLMITFAGGTPANVNAISQAGTGNNGAVCTKLYPNTNPAGPDSPCRPAFIATNLQQLIDQLNAALNQSTATGEFSDQQSISESVYEFVDLSVNAAANNLDPLNPKNRYSFSLPMLLQSTFVMPGFEGHLNAVYRNENGTAAPTLADDTAVQLWDAGEKLRDRVLNGADTASATDGMLAGTYTFEQLYGLATETTVKGSSAKIQRRIFTTARNGVNSGYNASNLLDAASLNPLAAGNPTRIALWPPVPRGAGSNAFVAPSATGTAAAPVVGVLDIAFGLDVFTTLAQVQAKVPAACAGAPLHAECSGTNVPLQLVRAKREAREIMISYLAGAQVAVNPATGAYLRNLGGDLLYSIRPWIMAESTLAAPGIVAPPIDNPPTFRTPEYLLYRSGVKRPANTTDPLQFQPQNGLANGLGLRHPDLSGKADSTVQTAAANNKDLKPAMTVVYHATNQGLHAFRAGKCPTAPPGGGLFGVVLDCTGETGGEELWAFVPFDQLGKVSSFIIPQTRATKQYLVAAPVRFSDVFVPAPGNQGGTAMASTISRTIGSVSTGPMAGVWRTMLVFGRGQGGKYLTALDVTTPGPFTSHALNTAAPIVMWTRGNPDTNDGKIKGAGNLYNYTLADYNAYLKMGETWSIPTFGLVPAASFPTTRSAFGTDFALFAGSGYSDTSTEGKTFYVMDSMNGDIIRNFDIADGSPAAPSLPGETTLLNALVSHPVVYTERTSDGLSPVGFLFKDNPVGAIAKAVYFTDLHSRIWRYDVTSPATPPTKFFEASAAAVGNQPFGAPVSIQQYKPAVPAGSPSPTPQLFVFAESGRDRRVATRPAPKLFKAYAFADSGGTRTDVYSKDFDLGYRGTVQPATAFTSSTNPVVFFAGVRYNLAGANCVSSFDSVLFALKSLTASPGTPEAAFDLRASGDDASIEILGNRIGAIQVVGKELVVDLSFNAQNLPPAPGESEIGKTSTSGESGGGAIGGIRPGSQAYKDLQATNVPYRVGSAVCRVEY